MDYKEDYIEDYPSSIECPDCGNDAYLNGDCYECEDCGWVKQL